MLRSGRAIWERIPESTQSRRTPGYVFVTSLPSGNRSGKRSIHLSFQRSCWQEELAWLSSISFTCMDIGISLRPALHESPRSRKFLLWSSHEAHYRNTHCVASRNEYSTSCFDGRS